MANFVWDSTDNISVSVATCCTGGRDPTHTPDSRCRAAERRESNKWSPAQPLQTHIISAVKCSIGFTIGFSNHGESAWLKAPTSAFTFKTLLRHYAKWALTPR